MAVSRITLQTTSTHDYDDVITVSAPELDYIEDDIILDVDPQGMYDTAFKVRTQSGAFEVGGRIVGEQIPIREPVLPFQLTKASRPRFQRLWGTPLNFKKVKCTWDGPSGPRSLILKLAKEILYTTEDGFDTDQPDDVYNAVVSALAVNPMYEGVEDVAEWVNPDSRFTITLKNIFSGYFTLTFTTPGGTAATTVHVNAKSGTIPVPTAATIQSALEALPNVGAGHVTVTLTPDTSQSNAEYLVVFTNGVNGALSGSGSNLVGTSLGLGAVFTIGYAPNTGWFDVWNPTDQPDWLEWEFDPAQSWQFPDHAFGQERKWGRTVGQDAARMIVTPPLTQMLSVMSDPFMDTYVNADLSNAAGLFNGVEPLYMVPPHTGTSDDPVVMPVVCRGPAGAKATLRQRRFWSAESGLEA